MKILFVCLGNICRSPLAEGLFLHLAKQRGLSDRFEVDSCGIGDWHVGHKADPRSQAVAHRNGITLLCTARQVESPGDFENFDLLVAMDGSNRRDLLELSPKEHRGKIRLMREWDPERDAGDGKEAPEVPDPYYGGPRGFDDMYAMLRRSCKKLLDELANTPERGGVRSP
jgi:protein-tyrosine phosphatase